MTRFTFEFTQNSDFQIFTNFRLSNLYKFGGKGVKSSHVILNINYFFSVTI